jgi:hypothetical protein
MDEAEFQRMMHTKAELVRELDRYQQFGVNLAFKPDINMDEDMLEHELQRHIANETIVQRVTAMKLIIQFGAIGLEWVTTKFNFMNLKGWSGYIGIQLNSGRYDSLMEQLYRTIWKRGAPNPWFMLASLVLGSAVAFHFKIATLDGQQVVANSEGAGGGGCSGPGLGSAAPAPAPAPAANPLATGINAIFGNIGGLFGGGGGGGNPLMGILNTFVDSNKPQRGGFGQQQAPGGGHVPGGPGPGSAPSPTPAPMAAPPPPPRSAPTDAGGGDGVGVPRRRRVVPPE